MERTRGFKGSQGWSIVDYSIQVQYTWVVSSFSIHRGSNSSLLGSSQHQFFSGKN